MLGHYVLYALMFEIGLFCNEHLRVNTHTNYIEFEI